MRFGVRGEQQISYATPVVATLADRKQIVMVCEATICGHDFATGELLWEHPFPGDSTSNASCSNPVPLSMDRLFVSKAYAHGCELLMISQENGQFSVQQTWRRPAVMKTKFTNAIEHQWIRLWFGRRHFGMH